MTECQRSNITFNDGETYLSRRKYYYYYYNVVLHLRLNETNSSSCAGCGMNPQDVPHMFNCTVNPTNFTPVILCDKPGETIRDLAIIDTKSME